MTTIHHTLINAAALANTVDVHRQLNVINVGNKSRLFEINDSGFTCVNAAAASYNNMRHPGRATTMVAAIIQKSKSVCSADEHKQLLITSSTAGFIPLHSAVNRGNYQMAIKLYMETWSACNAPFEFSRLLSKKNIPNWHLEQLLFGCPFIVKQQYWMHSLIEQDHLTQQKTDKDTDEVKSLVEALAIQ